VRIMSDWSAPLLGRIETRCAQQRGAQQERQLAATDTVGTVGSAVQVGQAAAAVGMEEVVGDVYGGGAAEGHFLGFVDRLPPSLHRRVPTESLR
jgi:hypothetical protein